MDFWGRGDLGICRLSDGAAAAFGCEGKKRPSLGRRGANPAGETDKPNRGGGPGLAKDGCSGGGDGEFIFGMGGCITLYDGAEMEKAGSLTGATIGGGGGGEDSLSWPLGRGGSGRAPPGLFLARPVAICCARQYYELSSCSIELEAVAGV